jgi:hypothetical protein
MIISFHFLLIFVTTSPKLPDRFWDPPSFLFSVCEGSFPRVKRLGCEAYHLPSSNANVNNVWSYTSTPSLCLHGLGCYNFAFTHIGYTTLEKQVLPFTSNDSFVAVRVCFLCV